MPRHPARALRRPSTAELLALSSVQRRAPAPYDMGVAGGQAVSLYLVANGPGAMLVTNAAGTSMTAIDTENEAVGDFLKLYDAGSGVLMPRWETWNPLSALTTPGDRLVHNGSAVVRLPTGTVAMGSGTEIDFAEGDVFTKTLTNVPTFTAANETWGHPSVVLEIEPAGYGEPTWPGTTLPLEGGTWSTVHTNYVVLTRLGAGSFVRAVSQVAS